MAESNPKGSMFTVEHSLPASSIQEFQFGQYDPGLGAVPGVRLRFTNTAGGFNNRSSQTMTLPQLAGLVEVAAPHMPNDLRMRLIAVLAGAEFENLHPSVLADAEQWVD